MEHTVSRCNNAINNSRIIRNYSVYGSPLLQHKMISNEGKILRPLCVGKNNPLWQFTVFSHKKCGHYDEIVRNLMNFLNRREQMTLQMISYNR